MTREEYEKLWNTEPDIIDLTDADIIAWLDDIADALKRVNNCRYDLYYGKLDRDKGEYEKHIELVSNDNPRLHVYDGIDTLAKIVGCELERIDRSDDDYPYEYHFTYKGVYVFQLNKKPLDGEEQ